VRLFLGILVSPVILEDGVEVKAELKVPLTTCSSCINDNLRCCDWLVELVLDLILGLTRLVQDGILVQQPFFPLLKTLMKL
jgi:hypothetical protein